MATEAQRAACRRYYARTKLTHKTVILRLNRDTDADVIAALDSQPNKAEYIRKLVRGDANGKH